MPGSSMSSTGNRRGEGRSRVARVVSRARESSRRAQALTMSLPGVHQRMPNADVAWLHMDRPTNLMVINSVMLFDSRLDAGRLREVIAERLLAPYPRFRGLVKESRLPLRGPSFETDPNFDLDRHLHHLGLPDPGDERALRELMSDLIATPL